MGGEYEFIVSDDVGCHTQSVSLNVEPAFVPEADVIASEVSCEGLPEIYLNAVPSTDDFDAQTVNAYWEGPKQFRERGLDISIANPTIENAGTYTVVIRDNTGCHVTKEVWIAPVDLTIEDQTTPTNSCEDVGISEVFVYRWHGTL